jgi:F-type H+-transporting ATPase subunit d
MKEAEKASLKESEKIEKEIAEMKEMKVSLIFNKHGSCFFHTSHANITPCLYTQKKISTMTADEYFAKHPELKQKFDDEIRNDYWGY